jgi:hypothetical protein
VAATVTGAPGRARGAAPRVPGFARPALGHPGEDVSLVAYPAGRRRWMSRGRAQAAMRQVPKMTVYEWVTSGTALGAPGRFAHEILSSPGHRANRGFACPQPARGGAV